MYTAILLAAGSGTRTHLTWPKQFMPLGGQPLYQHALDTLLSESRFSQIILVCHPAHITRVKEEVSHLPVTVIEGGNTRQESVFCALTEITKDNAFVLIHDAARPFVSPGIIDANITHIALKKAIDTSIKASDTIVYSKDGSIIDSIPDRSCCYQGQTPQTFDKKILIKAHHWAAENNLTFTCDCSLVTAAGFAVSIVKGDPINFKITTPLDFEIAEALIQKKHLTKNTKVLKQPFLSD
jgi:2-C-methyl-D-erythritol 4-phosphate cytidylyltransferase